jgi:alpha-L-fucosidase
MNRERIPKQEYHSCYVDSWKAEAFDPEDWMAAATSLGASYVVLTTRHHDGFALWDSQVNSWNSVRYGPKRDIVADFVEAARRAGLAVGLYYSIANWTHPDYPGAFCRDWPLEKDWSSEEALKRFQAYNLAEIEELMSGYGKIDYLWYDGGEPKNIRNPEMNAVARKHQPDILITQRNSPDGEVAIMEQGIRSEIPDGLWEACFTLNRNWGYHADDTDYKRPSELIELLLTTAGGGGNLLLNLGPDAAGRLPDQSRDLVDTCGHWIRAHRCVLDHAIPSPFGWNNSCLVSTAGTSVFLHFYHPPEQTFCWAETKSIPSAVVLHPEQHPIPFHQDGERLTLEFTNISARPDVFSTVELRYAEAPSPSTAATTHWIPDA